LGDHVLGAMVVGMADTAGGRDSFRDSFAPGVPAAERRRLAAAEAGRDGAVYAAFAALVAVLFGVAGLAVLLSGAAPDGASKGLFDAVAGGGALLVALAAGVIAARGGAHAVTRRMGTREERYVGQRRLAELAQASPERGRLVARVQVAADRIRSTAAFGGPALDAVVDADGLDRIEWTLIRQALLGRAADHRADDRADDLADQVERLDKLAGSAERIDRALAAPEPAAPGTPTPTSLREFDDLERAAGAADDVERYLRGK
jgi:hypothetical protein